MKVKRMDYLDSLRFFSMLIILLTHFFDFYYPKYFGVANPFLFWFNSTSGLIVFCLLLGFFAMDSKQKSIQYLIKRYFQFTISPFIIYIAMLVFCVFLTNVNRMSPFTAFANIQNLSLNDNIYNIIQSTVLIDSDRILATLWTLFPFFVASMLIFIVDKLTQNANISEKIILLSIIALILYFLPQDQWSSCRWMSYCVIGAICKIIYNMDLKIFKKYNIFMLLLSIVSFVLIFKITKSYTFQVLGFGIFLIAINYINVVKRILSFKPLSFLGRISFYSYMWHHFIIFMLYEIMLYNKVINLEPYLYENTFDGVALLLILTLVITLILSIINYYLYDIVFSKKILIPLLNIKTGKVTSKYST